MSSAITTIIVVIYTTLFEVIAQQSIWTIPVKGEDEHIIAVLDYGVIQKQEKKGENSSLTNAKIRKEEYNTGKQRPLPPPPDDNQHKHKKILFVDDEPDICLLYQIVLKDAGYECNSYIDPIKALDEFRADYYGLILLDIKMPKLNGLELCRIIREQDKSIKIIFITAAAEFSYEQLRSQQQYPDLSDIYYIQKPIGNEELVKRVNAIIKQ
jgi:CheY-like chemotaxis protein